MAKDRTARLTGPARLLLAARAPAVGLYWPVAYLVVVWAAKAHKFRLAPHRALLLLPQDLVAAALLGVVIHLALRRVRRRAARPLVEALVGLAVFMPLLWFSLLGIMLTGLLHVPLDAKLLFQVPSLIFVRTALNTDAVGNSLAKLLVAATVLPLGAAAVAYLLARACREGDLLKLRWPAGAALLALVLAAPWLSFDEKYRDTNAAVTLISSAAGLALQRTPPDPKVRPGQFQEEVATLGTEPRIAPPESLARLRFSGKRYDVFVIVLETGVAQVMDLEGDGTRWLPNLRRITRRSIRCRKHLTPFPSSTKSIFALISGRYPFPNYRSLVRTWPRTRFETFVSMLAAEGYRTGAYTSIDGDYDRMDEFLASHGVDHLSDRRSLNLTPLKDPTFGSDAELFERYRAWLLAEPEKPSVFFLLPSNSHWPFFCPPEDRLFEPIDAPARYRNSLQHQDRLVGEHLAWLAETGRLDRTILVVAPDHGGYFGLTGGKAGDPAGLMAHHVPLLIDHPLLRKQPGGAAIDAATSHVDLAPTLLAMCSRSAPPPDFQGLSLIGPRPARRLVFYYQDFAEGRLSATDGESIVRWERRGDRFTGLRWVGKFDSSPGTGEVEAALEKRLRTFWAYQLHFLQGLVERPKAREQQKAGGLDVADLEKRLGGE